MNKNFIIVFVLLFSISSFAEIPDIFRNDILTISNHKLLNAITNAPKDTIIIAYFNVSSFSGNTAFLVDIEESNGYLHKPIPLKNKYLESMRKMIESNDPYYGYDPIKNTFSKKNIESLLIDSIYQKESSNEYSTYNYIHSRQHPIRDYYMCAILIYNNHLMPSIERLGHSKSITLKRTSINENVFFFNNGGFTCTSSFNIDELINSSDINFSTIKYPEENKIKEQYSNNFELDKNNTCKVSVSTQPKPNTTISKNSKIIPNPCFGNKGYHFKSYEHFVFVNKTELQGLKAGKYVTIGNFNSFEEFKKKSHLCELAN